jgi:hypothetical protein
VTSARIALPQKRKTRRGFLPAGAHVFRAIATTGTSAVSSFVAIDDSCIDRNSDRSMTEKSSSNQKYLNRNLGNRQRNGGGGHDQHPSQGRKDRDARGDPLGEPIPAGPECAHSRRDDGNC